VPGQELAHLPRATLRRRGVQTRAPTGFRQLLDTGRGRPQTETSPLDNLTPRERQVLAQMAEGRSNVGIGRELTVTVAAVERHVTSTFESSACISRPTSTAGYWPSSPTCGPDPCGIPGRPGAVGELARPASQTTARGDSGGRPAAGTG
jgi:DNA-binding CsgD family transcriptional regulator